MSRTQLRPRRRSVGHARRPSPPLRRRLGARLPSRGRLLALLVFVAALSGLVMLVYGPWLRITSVDHAGQRYTSVGELDAMVEAYRGTSLLSVDTEALRARLTALPTVADATVQTLIPGQLRVAITEKSPAFVWRTSAVQLISASDGTVLAELALSSVLGGELAELPQVSDERVASRGLTIGDVLPAAELRVAERLVALDPDLIGSRSRQLSVSVDDELGFLIASLQPPWQAAMGFYELDPREDRAAAEARLERQLAAIRTLFAEQGEQDVSWLDARNPGKVYWAP